MWFRKEKDNFLCFASGKISQSLLKVQTTSENTFFKEESLALEGCPNLRCHKEEGTTTLFIIGDCDLFKQTWKQNWREIERMNQSWLERYKHLKGFATANTTHHELHPHQSSSSK